MQARRVFIVGNSLFAETLARTLSAGPTMGVQVVGSAPTAEAALPFLRSRPPEAVIITGAGLDMQAACGQLLAAFPDLPLIRADLGQNDVHVITCRRIGARSPDLIAAIAALPERS